MMKRALCLLLVLFLLPACALGDTALDFALRVRYGAMVDYENLAFDYALQIFSKFYMYPDETLEAIWADMDETEDGDAVYDIRYWLSPDSAYLFHVQVKEPTYDSLETEIKNAPDYLSLVYDDLAESGCTNITQLHDGVLRDTPAGQMLETAIAFDSVQDGQTMRVVSMYYDFYYGEVEYIFQLYAYGQSYDDAQALLNAIAQTVEIVPGTRRV